MTPAARVQAAIELLDEVIGAARGAGAAADTIIARYFKTRRYAGAKDRRAVRELVYRAIRRSAERPESGRAAMLGLVQDDPELLGAFDGSAHGAAAPGHGEGASPAGDVPAWLRDRFDPLVGESERAALLGRAQLDLRVNRLKSDRDTALTALEGAEPTPLSPIGLRLTEGTRIDQHALFNGGSVEVQDEGSQLIALACGVAPEMKVVDLCAGAGGKTLTLAAEMANSGTILACDTDRGRLFRLEPRAARAGACNIQMRLLNPTRELVDLEDWRGVADVVLVDAPCSGTGTWRRNPETRWRLDEQRLHRLLALQAHILEIAAHLVRPGGHLVYAVCSLLGEEGRGRAEAFGNNRSAFVSEELPIQGGRPSGAGRLLTPDHDGTDGFFIARWRAPC